MPMVRAYHLLVHVGYPVPSARAAPAACPASADRPPIFFICSICYLKSSRSKPLPLLTFLASFSASLDVYVARAPLRPATGRRPCRGCAKPCARDGTAPGAIELLAHAHELDRLAGHLAHRKRRAAARVAVELGQHHTGERQRVVEGLGHVDRVLALHRVDHEQRLDRIQRRMQRLDLVHHRLVDRQGDRRYRRSARRGNGCARSPVRRRARCRRGFCSGVDREELDVELPRQRAQLVDRRRTVDVATHQQHFLLQVLAQAFASLPAVVVLPGALQARPSG